MKYSFLLLACLALLQGCSANKRQVIAQSDEFLIVQPTKRDSFQALAEAYLGNSKYASVIERYNPGISANSGSQIAIPMKNLNQSGVFVNGYQTIPVLCYHQFTAADKSKNKMVVSQAEFAEQMKYLSENGYNVLPLEDLAPFLSGQKELPNKSVIITIDDGYKSYLEVAYPILKKYGFPSTAFIYPEFIGAGLALKWRDVKFLSNDPLVSIQSHSKSHDSLSKKPAGETDANYLKRLNVEVVDAEKILSRKTGKTIHHFAYPYGNSSVQLVELLKQNDYSMALTVNNASNPAFSAPFLLHRSMIYGGDSLRTFKRNLDTFNSMELK